GGDQGQQGEERRFPRQVITVVAWASPVANDTDRARADLVNADKLIDLHVLRIERERSCGCVVRSEAGRRSRRPPDRRIRGLISGPDPVRPWCSYIPFAPAIGPHRASKGIWTSDCPTRSASSPWPGARNHLSSAGLRESSMRRSAIFLKLSPSVRRTADLSR